MTTQPRTPSFAIVEPIVASLLDASILDARPIDEGAYSPSGRWIVSLGDGRSVFVKAELDASDRFGTAVEHLVASLVDAPWVPRTYGYEPGVGDRPRVLVSEDLSHARWGIPVTGADAGALSAAIDAMAATPAPEGLRDAVFEGGWLSLDRDQLAATGLVARAWLDAHIPLLADAAAAADLSGSSLVHCDVWRQNWCIDGARAVFVDWSSARRGNTMLTRAWAEAAVRATGALGGQLLSRDPVWASWMAARTCIFLTDHDYPRTPRLDETERRETFAALVWASEELGIEPPVPAPGALPPGPWRP